MRQPVQDAQGDDVEVADPGLMLDRLNHALGFHLRMANGVMHREFVNMTSKHELTQKQTGVLIIIGANPGVSQVDIALTLRTDRATMMGIVDRLQARGLVIRQRSLEDRRKQELYLSDAGIRMREELDSVIDGHEQKFTEMFSARELETLVDLLRRIHHTL